MQNKFRNRLIRGDKLIGTMLTLTSPAVAEILASSGYDWLFIDCEHGPFETGDLLSVLQAVGDRAACIVRVSSAAEVPIKGVEISVDGTRYFAISITDGSYKLRLEEYTLGDEITLTTSHEKYEDKTTLLQINSPDIRNQDIFLNPVSH